MTGAVCRFLSMMSFTAVECWEACWHMYKKTKVTEDVSIPVALSFECDLNALQVLH